MEIGTVGEQRRSWRLEDKLRIVAEAEQPGAVLSAVARQHAITLAQGDGFGDIAVHGARDVTTAAAQAGAGDGN